ncbi:hypothetical protein TNCV_1691531 [Trichonephila clavipes]|nr:hypothetical protein TNCV_1691531 [Trichonephila clavipes]
MSVNKDIVFYDNYHSGSCAEKMPWPKRSQVAVINNSSERWNTTENDVSKNQSSSDTANRLPNTSILNSNVADITEYFLVMYQTTLY